MTVGSPPEAQAGMGARRARHGAVKAAGVQAATLPPASPDGAPLDAPGILHRTAVRGGWHVTALPHRGDRLRPVNADGTAALPAWALHDPSGRLDHAGTFKAQWPAEPRRGRAAFSDMGWATLSPAEGAGGARGAWTGGSTAAGTLAQRTLAQRILAQHGPAWPEVARQGTADGAGRGGRGDVAAGRDEGARAGADDAGGHLAARQRDQAAGGHVGAAGARPDA